MERFQSLLQCDQICDLGRLSKWLLGAWIEWERARGGGNRRPQSNLRKKNDEDLNGVNASGGGEKGT